MIKVYNRIDAVEYAQKWALGANPDFFHFEDFGGDCTNFVSQCLLAGGSVMNYDKYYGWYYVNSSCRSPSWASVEYLKRFLLTNSSLGPFAQAEKLENLKIGDIIQLKQHNERFNHTLIISKIENGEIFVCAHSNDAKNRPLSTYNYYDIIGIQIEGSYL
jgi:hypothetical protein